MIFIVLYSQIICQREIKGEMLIQIIDSLQLCINELV
jgi:hypothetical protein